jgi:hypothetical protein
MLRSGGGSRFAAALALAAALLVTAAPLAAAGPGEPGREAPARPVLEALGSWARAWLGIPWVRTAPEATPSRRKSPCDAGASIDPNGCPTASSPAGETADAGLSIDPNG